LDLRHLDLEDVRKRCIGFVRLLVRAGASDAEVHAICASLPSNYGRPLLEGDGIREIATLCDLARSPEPGARVRILGWSQQEIRRWATLSLEVLDGPHAGVKLDQALLFNPVSERPGRPWYTTFGWWRVWEAVGLPIDHYLREPPLMPPWEDFDLLVGREAHVRLHPAYEGAVATGAAMPMPIATWCPRPKELAGSPPAPAPFVPPNEPKLPWQRDFDAAFRSMADAGLRIDMGRWESRLARFRGQLEAEIAAAKRGKPVRPRRDGAETVLAQLDAFDRELRRRLAASPDGRVRADWHQLSWPGRLTTRGLALQNLPRAMRPAFVPEPGYSFVLADWSACQPHILAALSGDPELLAVLQDPSRDLYVELGRMAWPDLPDDRDAGKGLALPLVYGAGPLKLPARAAEAGRPIPDARVFAWGPALREAFDTRFPTLRAWMRKRSRVYDWNSPLGRRIVVPRERREAAKVIAGFAQSIEADALRLALATAKTQVIRTGARVVLAHHDALLFECPENQAAHVAQEATRLLDAAMGQMLGGAIRVPVKVQVVKEWPNPQEG